MNAAADSPDGTTFPCVPLVLLPMYRYRNRPRSDCFKVVVAHRIITEEEPTTEPWLRIVEGVLAPHANDRHNIFCALLHQKDKVVVKLGSTDTLQKERDVGLQIKASGLCGFVRHLHYFECKPGRELPRTGNYIGGGVGRGLKVLVMPLYEWGDLRAFMGEVATFRDSMKQACFALVQGYVRLGLIYNDAHTGNVLLRPTAPGEDVLAYDMGGKITVALATNGVVAEWVDFESVILPREGQNRGGGTFPKTLLSILSQFLLDCGFRNKAMQVEDIVKDVAAMEMRCRTETDFPMGWCRIVIDAIDGFVIIRRSSQ